MADIVVWDKVFSWVEWSIPHVLRDMELLLRIFLAIILGMLIGCERKNRMKSAGMRTHAMVALGSALMMVVSKYGFSDTMTTDGARLAAQVVSGVGFLGAGMIFVRHNVVSGLTTAAGIWTTAGIGLTIGAGMYFVGILSALMMVIMQSIAHRISWFSSASVAGQICITILQDTDTVKEMEHLLMNHNIDIHSIRITKTEIDKMNLVFDVMYPRNLDRIALLSILAKWEDVFTLENNV